MKHTSRLLALVLALAMLFSLVTVNAMAEGEATVDLTGYVVILHSNDTHGHDVSADGTAGMAGIAQLKADYEAMGAFVIVLDAGDASQGTSLVNLSQGANAISFMNAVGYTAMCPGNHEFDWGLDNLRALTDIANFPVLAANIIDKTTQLPVFKDRITVETPVGKIGIFGLDTPETMTKANPDKVQGITFLAGKDLYACAQAQADALRADGCKLVVCLGHLGMDEESEPNRSCDVADNTTGIDLFIDGHSHTEMDGGLQQKDSLIVSTGESFNNIGVVMFDGTNLAASLVDADNYNRKAEAVNTLVNGVNDEIIAQLNVKFAETTVLLDGNRDPGVRTQETNLGDFAADAILWAAKKAVNTEVVAAVTNGGGIRTSIQIGDVTMNDMKTVFPFGNQVTLLTVTGAELLEALEAATNCTPTAIGAFPQVAGIEFTIDTTVAYENGDQYPDSTYFAPKNPGSRVTIQTVGGEAWAADKEYTIATNDFTAAGGDTYYVFRRGYAATGYKTGVSLEDALVEYTTTVLGGTIGETYAAPAGRITVK